MVAGNFSSMMGTKILWANVANLFQGEVLPRPDVAANIIRSALATDNVGPLEAERFHSYSNVLSQVGDKADPRRQRSLYTAISSDARALARITEASGIINAGPFGAGPADKINDADDGGTDDGDQGIITLRDYQRVWLDGVVASIVRGEDRILARAPMQTGKTLIVGPLHSETKIYFPGKTMLIVYPFKVIGRQILEDLKMALPEASIGIIDDQHKDIEGDHEIILASMRTLGREEHLKKLDPSRVGLTIMDEATFSLAKMWQGLLKHLGFLDSSGSIVPAKDKYLLGLTADPFVLKKVFGEGAQISSQGLLWFMEHGYLHNISYMMERYGPEVTVNVFEDGGELIAVPAASDVHSNAVVGVYKRNLDGKKVLVTAAGKAYALQYEKAFNLEYGAGYAAAIYSGGADGVRYMSDEDAFKILDSFNAGRGPKVLIYIRKIAFGARLKGVEGVINPYQTGSLRLYGQRLGRPLGIGKGEEQREIMVIDMVGGRVIADKFVTLLRFLGAHHQFPNRAVHSLLERSRKYPYGKRGRTRRLFVPCRNTRLGINFKYDMREGPSRLKEGKLQGYLMAALEEKCGGDLIAMAQALGTGIDELDSYLYGALPKTLDEARLIARGIGANERSFVAAWEEDALAAIDFVYPISNEDGEGIQEFIRMVRLATLHLGGLGAVHKAVTNAGCHDATYNIWNNLFAAKITHVIGDRRGESGKSISTIIGVSGVAPEPVAWLMLEDAMAEMKKERKFEDVPVGGMGDVIRTGMENYLLSPVETPYDILALRDIAAGLSAAIDTLDAKRKDILKLYFWDDMTFEEIGELYGETRSNIQALGVNAITQLGHLSRRKLIDPSILI